MKKLLDFLLRKKHWFLFIVFEVISIVLVYQNNSYQRSVLINSGNIVSGYLGSIYGKIVSQCAVIAPIGTVDDFVSAGEVISACYNLFQTHLCREGISPIEIMQADTVTFRGAVRDSIHDFPYQFIMAEISSNSFVQLSNYITLNKGRIDGIQPDMGVVSDQGVVGVVSQVSDHFSVVIPLLNPKSRLSCKVLGNNNFGYLIWDGKDASCATLEELPKHAEFNKGDTIVTSGYSAIFPPGLIVGTIEEFYNGRDDNFYSLKIRLATSFQTLQHVRVIRNFRQEEQINLEKEAKKNDQ